MIGMNEARERILYANFLQPGREGHDRGSAHVCEEMRLERLYLSVSDDIKTEGAASFVLRLRMNSLSEKRQVLYASMWIKSSHFRARH